MNKETLEEAAERCFEEMKVLNPKGGIKEFIRMSVNFGIKWQGERMYSEEEVLDLLYKRDLYLLNKNEEVELELPDNWIEQFKKEI